MLKLTVLYTPPTDPDAFEAHYLSTHMPIAAQIPGLVKAEAAKVIATPDGSTAQYYRQAHLYFDDLGSLGAGMGSEQGQATAKDAAELVARTGSTMTMLISEVDA